MYTVTEQYSQNIAKAVRTTTVSGFIKTKSGEILTINDSSIKTGSLSISSRLNSSGDFKPGGVYSSELSVTLLGIAADSLDGARITLDFLLYRGNSEEYDSIPLGTFYVDGSTIKRRGTAVSLKADDALMNFDYPAEAISGSLHELAAAACVKCDVPLRTSTEEFAGLPNADITAEVDTSRVQTCRDLLIFIAMLTGTFVRIDRTGGLCFVPLTCERNSGGVIIPVREIAGNIRSSTEFSDDTTRITKLFMRRGGEAISAERNFPESSEIYAALELMENPLLAGLGDEDVQAALAKTLAALSICLNRAFKSDFNGDPALETGDYVRLRGGAVDTSRGYATGMITSQVWRYHGKHTIQCSLSSSVPPDESVQTFALLVADDTAGAVSKMRVQPKSQLEKELDALRGKTGTDGVGKAAESDPTSEYFNDYENNKIVTYAAGYHHVEGKDNKCGPATACHAEGVGNVVRYGTALRAEGSGNTLDGGANSSVCGGGNVAIGMINSTRIDGTGNNVKRAENAYVTGRENTVEMLTGILAGNSNEVNTGVFRAIFGDHLAGSAGSRPRMIIGEYNQSIYGVDRSVSLAFEIGCGNSSNRKSCFAVDYEGNVYCNKVIETGTDNILGGAADETAISAQAARAITSAASAGIPIVLLDHAPTANDLTGSECVFLQCDDTASVEGETTGIFRVTDIFAEKSLQ